MRPNGADYRERQLLAEASRDTRRVSRRRFGVGLIHSIRLGRTAAYGAQQAFSVCSRRVSDAPIADLVVKI